MGISGMNPGSPGFAVPRDENEVARRLRDAERAIQQVYADGTLRALVDNLPAQVSALVLAAIATSITTGTLNVTGNAVVSGSTTANGTLYAPGAVATDLTLLSGTRRPLWIHDATGTVGHT